MMPKMGMPPGGGPPGGGAPGGGAPRNAPPMIPDAVKKLDPECQEIYLQVYDECSSSGGAEMRRCMGLAMTAALEHQYGGAYDEGGEGPPMEDDEAPL